LRTRQYFIYCFEKNHAFRLEAAYETFILENNVTMAGADVNDTLQMSRHFH